MGLKSSSKEYRVFISHAGEDKATIASPLREMLEELGISAFLDESSIPSGGDAIYEMTSAMENADIAVIVLSAEFVAKKWPMRELLFFLNRRKKTQANGGSLPVIIPVFYRLNVEDMYREPRLDLKDADGKSLYRKTRFFERTDNGEPEANVEIIRNALITLRGIMGVENKYHASNEVCSAPSRLLFLKDICAKISQVMAAYFGEIFTRSNEGEGRPRASGEATVFQRYFHPEVLHDVVLDFQSMDTNGNPLTHEGHIKNRIMNRQEVSQMVFAIHGMGGVGKSTILKGLANDEDFRNRFRDGIYFILLGMDATVTTLFQELCRVLRDSGAVEIEKRNRAKTQEVLKCETDKGIVMRDAIRDASRDVMQWFRGKRCAFLIDDVWTSKISAPQFSQVFSSLRSAGPDIGIVFTTRERDIASVAAGENMLHVHPRDVQGSVSQKILFCHGGMKENCVVESHRECLGCNYGVGNTTEVNSACTKCSIREILRICSGLPVGLATAGKAVKKLGIDMDTDHAWREHLMMIRNYRERLLLEHVGGYGNLYLTFGASICLLEERKNHLLGFCTPLSFGQMHMRLWEMEKQVRIYANALKHLWGLRNEEEVKRVGNLFAEVGLAEIEHKPTSLCWNTSKLLWEHRRKAETKAVVYRDMSLANIEKQLHDSVENRCVWSLTLHDSVHDYAIAEARRVHLTAELSPEDADVVVLY